MASAEVPEKETLAPNSSYPTPGYVASRSTLVSSAAMPNDNIF